MSALKSVEVRTSLYEFTHGRAPRGEGYWAFKIGQAEPHFVQGIHTYGRARAAAQREARLQGLTVIEVLP